MNIAEFLQDPDSKASIKRALLVAWFVYMCTIPMWNGQITLIHFYIFIALLSSKTIESVNWQLKTPTPRK